MSFYLYRVVITEYPAGSLIKAAYGSYPDPDWTPEGWKADDEWVSRFHSTCFFWPSTGHDYKSRSGARARAQLIESFGAKTVIHRSSKITWPEVTS